MDIGHNGSIADCKVMASWRPISASNSTVPNGWRFEIVSTSSGWAAIGLSYDSKMGKDLTAACIRNPTYGIVEVYGGSV